MKLRSISARLSPCKKPALLGMAAVLIMGLAIVLGGCVKIDQIVMNDKVPAGSNQLISIEFKATTDAASPVRGVFAIRIPSAWSVKTVGFSGAVNGTATESAVMEGVYSTDWETTAGPGHNGHKGGYKWWVGYSTAGTWTSGQQTTVTVAIDTHGRGGTYNLDFATGLASAATPPDGNPTADKGMWQIGSAGDAPTGVALDKPITLYSFTDVRPGAAYYDAIQGLGAKGVIQGYPSGSGGSYEFRSSNPVLRAQYAKMIDGALGLPVDEAMTPPVDFKDLGPDVQPGSGVVDSLYPHEYVWVAFNNNIIRGFTDGTFRPYIPVIRGHVVTMTVRALENLHPAALQPVPAGYVQTWGNDLAPEHKANARIAQFNNLLAGLPLTTTAANGNAAMSRGEVAQVLWNMTKMIAP